MWINTKSVFEWDKKEKRYIETSSEGYEHNGEVDLCHWNTHKGNDAAWKADDKVATAAVTTGERMAAEFWHVSGTDSTFVHQLQSAQRELDDTVESGKDGVRQAKATEEKKQQVEGTQGRVNLASQATDFKDKMDAMQTRTAKAAQATRSAGGAAAYEKKITAGKAGFAGKGGRAEKVAAKAAKEAMGDVSLGFLEGKSSAEQAMADAELSFQNKQVAGATASQQAVDAADDNMRQSLKSARTAFTNQFSSVKDALRDEQQSMKQQLESTMTETSSGFQNNYYNSGGWNKDTYASAAYGTGFGIGFDPGGKLWQQILNSNQIGPPGGASEPTATSGFDVDMTRGSNPQVDWGALGIDEDLEPEFESDTQG